MKRFTPLALLVTLASSFALAEWNEAWWDDWDTDDDGELNDEEFLEGYHEHGLYDAWDLDGDGAIDEDEFGEGLFDYYDANDDGDLTDDEFDIGDDDATGFWNI